VKPATWKTSLLRFIAVWLVLMAVLLAWKRSVYPEALEARRFLGMPLPAAADVWWLAAGCASAAVVIGIAVALLRRHPRRRRQPSA
jgi:hypothetical protein